MLLFQIKGGQVKIGLPIVGFDWISRLFVLERLSYRRLRTRCAVGVSCPRESWVFSYSEKGAEGAIVRLAAPVGTHEFFGRGGVRPAVGVVLAFVATSVMFPRRWSMEGGQGGELRQVALIQLISILEKRTREQRERE